MVPASSCATCLQCVLRARCVARCLVVANLHVLVESRTPASAVKYAARAFFSFGALSVSGFFV